MLPTAKKLFHMTRLENNGGWIFFLQIIWVPFRIPKCNDILHSYVFMLQQSLFSRRWKSSFLFPLGEIFCTRPHGWTITRGPPPRIMPPFYLELFFAPSHQLGPGVITASKRLLSDDDWYMLLSLSLSLSLSRSITHTLSTTQHLPLLDVKSCKSLSPESLASCRRWNNRPCRWRRYYATICFRIPKFL